MVLPKFDDIKVISNSEISDKIIGLEKELFTLRFKKATRQTFKSHEIKLKKRTLAQLKTLLTLRLNLLDKKQSNFIMKLNKKYKINTSKLKQ